MFGNCNICKCNMSVICTWISKVLYTYGDFHPIHPIHPLRTPRCYILLWRVISIQRVLKSEFVPEVVFLPQVSKNVASRIFTAETLTYFNRFNVSNYFYKVVIQHVAFTFQKLNIWSVSSLLISPWMLHSQFAGPDTHSSHDVVMLEVLRKSAWINWTMTGMSTCEKMAQVSG